jgi:hypothetical protein
VTITVDVLITPLHFTICDRYSVIQSPVLVRENNQPNNCKFELYFYFGSFLDLNQEAGGSFE